MRYASRAGSVGSTPIVLQTEIVSCVFVPCERAGKSFGVLPFQQPLRSPSYESHGVCWWKTQLVMPEPGSARFRMPQSDTSRLVEKLTEFVCEISPPALIPLFEIPKLSFLVVE